MSTATQDDECPVEGCPTTDAFTIRSDIELYPLPDFTVEDEKRGQLGLANAVANRKMPLHIKNSVLQVLKEV